MAKKEKACKHCRMITSEDTCIYCNIKTSGEWFGFVYIVNPEESEIAQKLGVKINGRYALRIR